MFNVKTILKALMTAEYYNALHYPKGMLRYNFMTGSTWANISLLQRKRVFAHLPTLCSLLPWSSCQLLALTLFTWSKPILITNLDSHHPFYALG